MMVRKQNPYVGFGKDRGGVRNLWERFNAGVLRDDEVQDCYQRLLLKEWQRCTALGVDVAMNKGRRLSEEEYQRRRDVSRLLLEKSKPILEDVSRYLVDVPGILILTECTGTILHITGEPAVRDRALTLSGIVEGSRWDESVAGSNGIGSAIAKRQPVHVFASEHFCEGWHTWSCAAAPILEPDGETLIGVIDFTTIDRDYRDQGLGLAVALANSIQAQIAARWELERANLLAVFEAFRRRYGADDLAMFDRAGRPVSYPPSTPCDHGPELDLEAMERLEVVDPETRQPIGTIAIRRTRRPADRSTNQAPQRPAPSAARTWETETATKTEEAVHFGDFVSADAATKRILTRVDRIARTAASVLLIGETGTGKDLLARHIHATSSRRSGPYVAVNCGAISKELLESTFFGYVRGAFSGADPKGRAGYFEAAAGGTLFLDEIGELPLATQTALLRVLEDGSFQCVGSPETRKADCRIIAATNRDLETEVAEGHFRQDLYYRLNVITFEIPPLRQRRCDIPLLSRRFVDLLSHRHGLPTPTINAHALALLERYAWPGNARELRNVLEAAVLCAEKAIRPDDLPPDVLVDAIGLETATGTDILRETRARSAPRSLAEHEREIIISALCTYGKITRVAKELNIARSTLYKKFSALGINHKEYLSQ